MGRSAIPGYLANYAEAGVVEEITPKHDWTHAVCIPACNEDASILETLSSIRQADGGSDALLILIVNGSEDAAPGVHEANLGLLELLRSHCGVGSAPIALGNMDGLGVLLIDRASKSRRLPARQGVGLARKIAADIALDLYNRGAISSPWLLCTDADVIVPQDYFTALPPPDTSLSAAVFPFEHTLEGDTAQHRAMRSYESYLHYYMLGLHWAGSPYAMQTIGSLFAIHAERYAAVRGFPKRMAGEDFYLLNKLAKVGPVLPLDAGRVQVRGRHSERVPFGTGAALRQIQVLEESDRDYTVYDPRVFAAVRTWISALREFSEHADISRLNTSLETDSLVPNQGLLRALTKLGAIDAAESASKNTRPGPSLARRLFEWNDAFRTLKLVHLLRDDELASMPLCDALKQAVFLDPYQPGSLQDDLEFLRGRAEKLAGVPVGIPS